MLDCGVKIMENPIRAQKGVNPRVAADEVNPDTCALLQKLLNRKRSDLNMKR